MIPKIGWGMMGSQANPGNNTMSPTALTPEETASIRRLLENWPRCEAVVVDALYLVQQSQGWIDDDKLEAVAGLLDLSPAYLDSLATFYPLLHRKPVGRQVIRYCDSVSCWLMGSETLAASLRGRLGIEEGETTPDGAYTLLPHPCLGACHRAPVAMVGNRLMTGLDPADPDALLEDENGD